MTALEPVEVVDRIWARDPTIWTGTDEAHWLGWLDAATPVPQSERLALRDYDFRVRELGYARDPMNKLAEQVFGAGQVENMLNIRMGREQMQRSRAGK
mgnify:CR=1 FL=1